MLLVCYDRVAADRNNGYSILFAYSGLKNNDNEGEDSFPPLVASASIILSKFVLADEIFQHAFKIRTSNLLQVVVDACAGLVDLDESTQVDGRADDHCIALGVVNRGL